MIQPTSNFVGHFRGNEMTKIVIKACIRENNSEYYPIFSDPNRFKCWESELWIIPTFIDKDDYDVGLQLYNANGELIEFGTITLDIDHLISKVKLLHSASYRDIGSSCDIKYSHADVYIDHYKDILNITAYNHDHFNMEIKQEGEQSVYFMVEQKPFLHALDSIDKYFKDRIGRETDG